ncbi:hypothetical protein EV424DRAFT_1560087 [Suillus variegatus]|nr:hypothetical protein EV424DRAFT_1560087 [Suillus variegatus]
MYATALMASIAGSGTDLSCVIWNNTEIRWVLKVFVHLWASFVAFRALWWLLFFGVLVGVPLGTVTVECKEIDGNSAGVVNERNDIKMILLLIDLAVLLVEFINYAPLGHAFERLNLEDVLGVLRHGCGTRQNPKPLPEAEAKRDVPNRPISHLFRLPFDLHSLMSEQEVVAGLRWNNNASVPIITLILYEYLLLLDKEVNYVWKRPLSLMSCLHLVVRYLGLFLALRTSQATISIVLIEWGFSVYFWFAEAILIWRLYAICDQSKLLLYVLVGLFLPIVALSIGTDIYLYSRRMKEIITPNAKYCTLSFNIGPMPAIYTSIPILFFAAAIPREALKERRGIQLSANSYMILIVRYSYSVLCPESDKPDLVGGIMGSYSDPGNESLRAFQRYCAIYSRTPSHHQYLGYACQG